MATTIRDIAASLAISHSTVSRALRNDPRISEETRGRVLQAAKTMGYHVNAAARALASRRMLSLALVIPDVVDPFYAGIIVGVDRVIREHKYSLVLYMTHAALEREEAAMREAAERRYDGGILFRRRLSDKQLRRVIQAGTPLVLMSYQEPDLPIDSVRIDDVDGGFKAGAHLIASGHRRLAFIGGPPDERETQDRRAGFARALTQHGVWLDPAHCYNGDFTEQGGYRVGQALAQLPALQRPTAVFAANDRMAIGLLQACSAHGLSVPGELAVIGYDDIDACCYVSPQLSTIRQPTAEMGEQAAHLLIQRLEGSTKPRREILLKTELVVRASCGGPSAMPTGTPTALGAK